MAVPQALPMYDMCDGLCGDGGGNKDCRFNSRQNKLQETQHKNLHNSTQATWHTQVAHKIIGKRPKKCRKAAQAGMCLLWLYKTITVTTWPWHRVISETIYVQNILIEQEFTQLASGVVEFCLNLQTFCKS